MATVTRTTTWVDQQILTASALNGEFNNLLNALALVNADISPSASIATSKINFGASAQGGVLFDNGSGIVELAAGTSGQFLQTQGSGANPIWAGLSNITAAMVSTGQLLRLVDNTQNYKIQFGSTSITASGSTSGIATTVTYPTAYGTIIGAWAGGGGSGSLNSPVVAKTIVLTDTINATNFRLVMQTGDGTNIAAATYFFVWVAIGF